MPKNRLRLDFSIETTTDRTAFVNSYLPTLKFKPNEHELNVIADYILWGKNESGLNAQQEGDIQLKEWATTTAPESLDALMEMPGFSENQVRPITAPKTRIPRVVFDRNKARERAPEYLRPHLEELFRNIDDVELLINYYDLMHGKRSKPPRDALLKRFSEEERAEIEERAKHLNQYDYLKRRHFLVELRSQQYTLSDTYTTPIVPRQAREDINISSPDLGALPLGLWDESDLAQKIFDDPWPAMFTDEELRQVSDLLWHPPEAVFMFDFRRPEHILQLYLTRADLREEEDRSLEGNAGFLVKTLQYYEDRAHLSDMQKEILEYKLQKKSNMQIATAINMKYNKSYNDNYISTIFHQKIIPSVAEAAVLHQKTMENIFFPENFKRCKDCGRTFLMTPDFFVRQKKSSDGFSPRCKTCEKIKRNKR